MDQEKNTETKTECRFQCSPTVIKEVWYGPGIPVSPGYSDTPPAKHASTATSISGENWCVGRACSSSD